MDTPIPIDEQMSKEREIERMDIKGKSHDSGEADKNYKTCKYANPIKDQNGHFDEIMCCYKNNEMNWCGVPCPLTKGE